MTSHLPVVEFLLNGLEEQARFPLDAIDTESNLSSAVLRDLLATVGMPYDSTWSGRELLLDGSLLRTRNDVAHGERTDVDAETYDQLHQLVLDLVNHLKTSIENRAASRAYLRAPTSAA